MCNETIDNFYGNLIIIIIIISTILLLIYAWAYI